MDSFESLVREMQVIKDKHEIEQCLFRYCRGIDRCDRELAQSAYHPDALDDHALYIGTGYGLVDWAQSGEQVTYELHHHYVTNSSIELDGDTAHVETYYIFAGKRKNASQVDLSGGRYIDRFERRDGRWGIAARICTVEWSVPSDMSETVTPFSVASARDKSDPSYRRPLKVDREPRVMTHP